jgi:mxaL protein
VLAALALAASFLNPVWPLTRDRFNQVVVVDVTQSMNVADMQLGGKLVSRLDYAKNRLAVAVALLPCGSRLGWAIFTESRSYLLFAPVEVCANRAELRATLSAISGTMAWSGNSEIAKGLHSGILAVKELPDAPALVFVSDGQEAPPLSPGHRPAFDDKPGSVAGLIVGVGDSRPSPIPKSDPQGRPLGFWSADEVMQIDPRSQGRHASVAGEQMADDATSPPSEALAGLGATPGSEHLSALREAYLRLLAAENRFAYVRLGSPPALLAALTSPALAHRVEVRADARWALAALAMALVLAPYAGAGDRARQTRTAPP